MIHKQTPQGLLHTSSQFKHMAAGEGIAVGEISAASTPVGRPDGGRVIGCELRMASVWSFLDAPVSAEVSLGRRFHSSAQIGNRVFTFGGETKTKNPRQPDGDPVKRMLDDLLSYDIVSDEWIVLDAGGKKTGPTARKGATLVAYKTQSLFLFGGSGPGILHNDLWEYDLEKRCWIDHTSPVVLSLCQQLGSDVLGETATQITKLVSNGMGSEAAQLLAAKCVTQYPAGRAYHIAAFHNDRLIAYGGYGFKSETSGLWTYSLHEKQWTNHKLAGMIGASHPGVRFGIVSCVYRDTLFIFGGQQHSKLVGPVLWRLDLNTLLWQQIATTGGAPAQRTYATSCLVGNRWFIHGGSSADDVFSDCHELNLDQLHWHQSASLFSTVTLEGHTSACVTVDWGVTSVMLLGGATSGPYIPAGPVMQCDFLLPSSSAMESTETIRLEDYVLKPSTASRLLWSMARSLKKHEEENSGDSSLVQKCETLQLQNHQLQERVENLEKALDEEARRTVSSPLQSTSADASSDDRSRKLEGEVARLTILADKSRMEVKQMTRKFREVSARDQSNAAVLQFVREIMAEAKEALESDVLAGLKVMLSDPSPLAREGNTRFVSQKTQLLSSTEEVKQMMNSMLDQLQRTSFGDYSPPNSPSLDSRAQSAAVESPMGRWTVRTHRTRLLETARSPDDVNKRPSSKDGADTPPDHKATDLLSKIRSDLSTVKQMASVSLRSDGAPMPGLNRGVTSQLDPAMGKLDLGTKSSAERKSSMRSGKGTGRVSKRVPQPSYPGVDCATQCGTGLLRLKVPSASPPSRSLSTMTSQTRLSHIVRAAVNNNNGGGTGQPQQ